MNMHRLARAPYLLALLLTIVGIFWTAPSAAQQGQDFFTVTPCRVYDSRGGGGPLDQGVVYTVPVAGTCGVPANAKSISLNVTILGASGSGLLKVYPTGSPQPFPHTLNFSPGKTIAHFGLVPLGTGGAVSFLASMSPPSPGKYHAILDVTGYFFDGPPTAVDDNYETEKDTVLNVVAADGVTDNDTLNGGSIVSYGATTGAEQTTIGASTPTSAGGTVALNADGSFTYTPPTGAVEIDDTFKYVLQNLSGSSTATVTIGVGKIAQTITFTSTAPTDASVGGPTYEVTATATSGLPVTFTIDASAASVCSIAGSTVSFIGVGTCVINADQAGDTSYNPAPQVQQSFPVVKGDQTITFTSTAPTDAKVGGPTYNVTATASSGLTVTFTIDASAASVCSIAGSTVSFLSVGTCVINANQAGDANWNPAPQVQQSFPVAKGDQTITFTSTAPSDATVNGPTYNVTATASSGLPVTFTIDASAASVCSIAGSTVSFTGAGTCVINANQAGDANYNPAPQAQQSFTVSLASQTISFTSTAPTDAKVNGPTYTVTATATSGLTVTFTIDASAASVCSIAGSTVSFIGAGTCVINANQAGDSSYAAAPQEQQSFPVVKNDQTITFTSAAPSNAQVAGPTYNVTATASSGLTVTFSIDASATSVCSIAGSTVSFLSVGTCVINANQAGDANYNPAPQVQQSFPVAQGDQSITFTSTAPVGAQVNGPTYTVTATATSGLPVTLTIDASASSVCTIAGSTVSFIGAGTCVINANQGGNANYNAAPQVQQSFPVAKGDQTITFTSTPPAGATAGGPTYTVTATATSGLAVIFTIDASASSVCSIAGSTVSFIGGGTCVINANQPGDANWNAAPQAQQSFPVAKQDQTITFTSTPPANAMVAGPTYTVTATATSGLPVTFTIDASASTVCSIAGSTVSFIGAGTCIINANQAGNAIYNAAPQVQQSFQVVKQDQTITFTSTPPALATIGGPTYTVTATATSGLPVTFTIDASAASVCTIAGSTVSFTNGGTCVINANQAGNTTYNPAPQVQQSFPVNFPPQPIANPRETFDTIGNTAFEFKAEQALSPSVFVAGNLRDNFTDSDGPSPLSVIAIVDGLTTNGGQVDVGTNGEFTYTPKAGDAAPFDEFTYQVTDGAYTINRTARINLRSRVWYVNNDDSLEAPAFDNGTSVDPFDTLAAAQTASSPNDYIFVYYGDGTTTGQNQGIALKNGQHLIGQFSGLTINFPAITFNGTAGTTSVTLLAQPSPTFCSGNPCRPLLDDTVAGAPEGVGAVDVIPAQIIGLNLAGNVNAIDWNTAAAISSTGTLTIRDNIVRSAGADGVDINLVGSGAVNLAFRNNNLTAGGIGLDIQETGTGSLTITAFNDNVVNGTTGSHGININSAIFDSNTTSGGFQQVNGNDLTIGSAVNPVGGSGLQLTSVQGNLFFDDLQVYSTSGTGLGLSGAGGGMTFAVTPASPDGIGLSTIDADNGAGVDISNAAIDLRLAELESTTSGSGLSLSSVSGQFRAPSGSSIIKSSGGGTAFSVGSSSVTVNYAGLLNVSSGAGVSLTSNTGTVNFSGALTLNTGTNPAFAATGGGTVSATDTSSTLTTTSGTALNVAATIGAGGLHFRSISSNGAVNGIVLNNTGALAGLTVYGTGTNNSGGTIQNTTGDGISLTSTRNVSLSEMRVFSSNQSNIDASSVTNLTLNSMELDSSTSHGILGNNITNLVISGGTFHRGGADGEPTCNLNGVEITNLLGTSSITGAAFTRSNTIQFHVVNSATTGAPDTLTVSGTTWGTHTGPCSGDHLSVAADTGGNLKLVTHGSSGENNFQGSGIGIQAAAQGSGTMQASITGVETSGNTAGVAVAASAAGNISFDVYDNRTALGTGFSGTGSVALIMTCTSSGTCQGAFRGNSINHTAGTATNAMQVVVEGNGTGRVQISDNTISGNCQRCLHAQSRAGTGSLSLQVNNNNLTATDAAGLQVMNFEVGASGGGTTNSMCLNLANNTVTPAGGMSAYRLLHRTGYTYQLQNLAPASTTNTADVQTWVTTTKANAGTPVSVTIGSSPFTTSAGCATPTLPSP